jgi:hypothetical protein
MSEVIVTPGMRKVVLVPVPTEEPYFPAGWMCCANKPGQLRSTINCGGTYVVALDKDSYTELTLDREVGAGELIIVEATDRFVHLSDSDLKKENLRVWKVISQ